MIGDSDRDVFVNANEFASSVVLGATTSTGVLRTRAYEEGEYGAKTHKKVLQVKRGTFSTPARDATVTIGGVAHKYRGVDDESADGGLSSGFDYWIVVPQ